ncbi:uncharacterized protein LOC108951268 isoform X1 [Musa acuminata AAA Group]|uniref:uncharacterized protein LOC108951268 isoform X1 n=1 Tax=Musa acuminata AAA Group TaxID=214697 RepID=UPI0031DF0891
MGHIKVCLLKATNRTGRCNSQHTMVQPYRKELAKYFENNDDARSLTFLLPPLMEEDFAHEELHIIVDATHHMEHMETDEITSGLQKLCRQITIRCRSRLRVLRRI